MATLRIAGSKRRFVMDVRRSEIFVKREYQRGLKITHSDRMAADWNFDAMGLPFVGKVKGREGYANLDSQHRLAAYDKVNGDASANHFLTCEVMEFEDEKQEAIYFRLRNSTYAVSKNQSFKAGAFAEVKPETTIIEIMKGIGVNIVFDARPRAQFNETTAGGPLKKVYLKLGHDRFSQFADLLLVYRDRKGIIEPAALTSKFLQGFAEYVDGSELDFSEMRVALNKAKQTGASAAIMSQAATKTGKENGEAQRRETLANIIKKEVQKVRRARQAA